MDLVHWSVALPAALAMALVLGMMIPMMQFNSVNAYREDDQVAILRRDLPAASFTYRDKELVSIEPDERLHKKALAFVNWASNAYRNGEFSSTKELKVAKRDDLPLAEN